MSLLTPLLIRAKYVAVIGETNVQKLEAAKLLPSVEEEAAGQVTDVTEVINGKRRRVRWWPIQKRLCTKWEDS